jgi:hypothetical protein
MPAYGGLEQKETLSLSLRLRCARARATGDMFGICPVFVEFLSSACSVSIQCVLEADSDAAPVCCLRLWTTD